MCVKIDDEHKNTAGYHFKSCLTDSYNHLTSGTNIPKILSIIFSIGKLKKHVIIMNIRHL